jgi:hypothetical protein
MHRLQVGVVLFIAGALSAPAYAGMLEAYAGVVAGNNSSCQDFGPPATMGAFFGALTYGIGNVGNGISDCGFAGSASDIILPAGPGPASSTVSLNPTSFNGGADTYSGAGTATAQYGSVSAGASGTLTGNAAGGTAESVGYAIASDTMTFNPGSPAGTTGYVVLQYTINSILTLSASAVGLAEVNVQLGSFSPQTIFYAGNGGVGLFVHGYGGSSVSGCVTGADSYTCTNGVIATSMLPVTFNTATAVDFGFYAGVDGGGMIDPSISLTGITLYNASQQVISNFTITSGSGTLYGADGVESSPEPSTFLLAAGALTALAWTRRVRRKRV